MSMEMGTCRKSGIEEISNYAVRLQDKGDKEARDYLSIRNEVSYNRFFG